MLTPALQPGRRGRIMPHLETTSRPRTASRANKRPRSIWESGERESPAPRQVTLVSSSFGAVKIPGLRDMLGMAVKLNADAWYVKGG